MFTANMTIYLACVFVAALLMFYALGRMTKRALVNYKRNFTQNMNAGYADMFMDVDSNRLFYYNILALVVLPGFIWFVTDNTLSFVATFIIVLVLPRYIYKSMHARRLATLDKQFPDTLMGLANAMRSGASLSIAMEAVAQDFQPPMSQEFALVLREQKLGVDFSVSLANMERRIPLQDFAMFTAAIRISREVGGNLTETLDKLADTLRKKQTMEGKIRSLTAQGKMQGLVMSGLPLLLMLVLLQLEPAAMNKLFTTHVGWSVLLVIAVMETLGYLAIRKITNIDV